MGLFQQAVRTYDAMLPLVDYGSDSFPLAPVAHTVKYADIEVILDKSGNFVSARERVTAVISDSGKTVMVPEPKIVIPVTEQSLGRTANAARLPHYLCDQILYLDPSNDVSYGAYLSQLEGWAGYAKDPKLDAILAYVKSGTIVSDLTAVLGAKKADRKKTVCWTVNGIGSRSGPCWTDTVLMESLSAYHMDALVMNGRKQGLCMMTGDYGPLAALHAKGVVASYGNAKLISSNSPNTFTFAGRFRTAEEALTVGYEASQKSHNALAWLVANQGVTYDKRVFLCWSPQGVPSIPSVSDPIMDMLGGGGDTGPMVASDYKARLKNALDGWKRDLPEDAEIVFVILDAPSDGCLSVLYYSEVPKDEYLSRLAAWDEVCRAGNHCVPLWQLVLYAYGTYRGNAFDIQRELRKQHMQRLVLARFEGSMFPFDIKQRLVANASKLALYDKKTREMVLRAAYAAVRKYAHDMGKGNSDMDLDVTCRDRSYLYGRLLAVADWIEGSVLYKRQEDRETSAMRMQQAFAQRPESTWRVIHGNLGPYLSQMSDGARKKYKDLIMEIDGLFDTRDRNGRLGDAYLSGYYEQRAAFRKEVAARKAASSGNNGKEG